MTMNSDPEHRPVESLDRLAEPPLSRLPAPRAEVEDPDDNVIAISTRRGRQQGLRDDRWLLFASGLTKGIQNIALSLERIERLLDERLPTLSADPNLPGVAAPVDTGDEGNEENSFHEATARVRAALIAAGGTGLTAVDLALDLNIFLESVIEILEILSGEGYVWSGPASDEMFELRRFRSDR